jgi:hypothetical protein
MVNIETRTAVTTPSLVATFRKSDASTTEASIEVSNIGATALNAFQVRRKTFEMVNSYILADATAEFANPDLLGCVNTMGASGDPTTLAPGASVLLEVPYGAHNVIELWAGVASGSTVIRATGES